MGDPTLTASKKKPVRRRHRPAEDVGVVRVPERFRDVVGELDGVSALKALYYLHEGERVGREGGDLGAQLREIRQGIMALLERAAQEQETPPDDNLIPFRPSPKRPQVASGGAAPPSGLTVGDAKAVREYCTAAAGGNARLANAAYARVMEDATSGGKLNSRWQTMAEDVIEKTREQRANPDAPSPEYDPLFADAVDADDPEKFDEGR